ncbi:ROK family glucokinase [Streptococcus parasuis]|uniref:Glucokinase n=1 Tax=Streptococcus parasuis TaxID=1501662 RepID=A0ABV2ESC9_9STRE|nr:ROK family glucokinase [Streptococcus parasuis]BCP58377.1 glucokinase [Streptococcus parasuis]BCP60474.1 glucokinase [Streptococcus parasuis]
MSQKVIGIDLGGTTVKMAIVSLEGEILQQWSIATDISEEGSRIVPDIISSIQHRLELYGLTTEDFVGIGMGTPGTVDRKNGTVSGAFNLNWKKQQPVRDQINKAFGLELYLDNDANVAALGEQWRGAGNNEPDVVFITLGTGVGGGIVANGQLLHGLLGSAGEIGHIGVDKDGFTCTCGNKGCLETVASATGIVKLARQMSESFAGNSQLKRDIDEGLAVTSKDIFQTAEAGDPFGKRVVNQVCDYLGTAAGNIANILNPSSIILGGGVSAAGEFLRSQVETYFKVTAFPSMKETTKIKLATLGNDAGVLGAASLVIRK